MKKRDGHKKTCHVSIPLAEKTEADLKFLLDRWGLDFQSFGEFIVVTTLEVALNEQEIRIIPEPPLAQQAGCVRLIRFDDSAFCDIQKYAGEFNLSVPTQCFHLLAVGLEVFLAFSGPGPLRKEEFKRQLKEYLGQRKKTMNKAK